MDTISRENNSMLPVGGIIVGALALIISIYAAVSLSKVKRAQAEQAEKVSRIETIEAQISNAAAASEKASQGVSSLSRSTQDAVTQIGNMIGEQNAKIAKLEEAAKARPVAAARTGSTPAVAGPDEYIIKSGDTFAKVARAQGVSLADIQTVNPGVDSSKLKVGQKIKLPAKR